MQSTSVLEKWSKKRQDSCSEVSGRTGRRRWALARPSLRLAKLHEFGRDEGLAKSGVHPYRRRTSESSSLPRDEIHNSIRNNDDFKNAFAAQAGLNLC